MFDFRHIEIGNSAQSGIVDRHILINFVACQVKHPRETMTEVQRFLATGLQTIVLKLRYVLEPHHSMRK